MLKELSELIGVSGEEDAVREYIKERIKNDVTEMNEDAYGNLLVRKGKEAKTKIMLAAHMDEVGFMIIGIEKSGLLKFRTIGIRPESLLAKRVIIGKDKISGVIGAKPIHLMSKEETKKIPEIKNLFIDIGATKAEAAKKLVEIGTCGTFATKFSENGDLIYGKAFDNRIGCYILIQLIKNTDLSLWYAFTTQEEAGLRGARIAAYRVSPSVAIAVDTTASGEWPEEKDLPKYPQIGKGPAITVADRSLICDKKLTSLIFETAKENSIPHQFKRPMVGGTDAGVIHITKEGVHCSVVAVPARYIHSPLSIAAKGDIEACINLLKKTTEKILQMEEKWN
jgi:endoglucanase